MKTRTCKKTTFFGRPGPAPSNPKRQHIYVSWVIFIRARRAREGSERVRFFSLFAALRVYHVFPRESEKQTLPEEASKRQMPSYVAYSRSPEGVFWDLSRLKHSTGAFFQLFSGKRAEERGRGRLGARRPSCHRNLSICWFKTNVATPPSTKFATTAKVPRRPLRAPMPLFP